VVKKENVQKWQLINARKDLGRIVIRKRLVKKVQLFEPFSFLTDSQ